MAGWAVVLFWWLAFGGTHLLLSSAPARTRLIARAGGNGFRGIYSLVALATFAPLVVTYWLHRGEGPVVWTLGALPAVHAFAVALSGLGIAVLVMSFFQPSATGMAAAEKRARGLSRITRHPLLTGFALWGIAHALRLGTLPDVIFFGGFAAYGLAGAVHQDARHRRESELDAFYRETSLLPFVAIAQGRTRLAASELPWLGAAIGIAASAVLYWLHPALFSR